MNMQHIVDSLNESLENVPVIMRKLFSHRVVVKPEDVEDFEHIEKHTNLVCLVDGPEISIGVLEVINSLRDGPKSPFILACYHTDDQLLYFKTISVEEQEKLQLKKRCLSTGALKNQALTRLDELSQSIDDALDAVEKGTVSACRIAREYELSRPCNSGVASFDNVRRILSSVRAIVEELDENSDTAEE